MQLNSFKVTIRFVFDSHLINSVPSHFSMRLLGLLTVCVVAGGASEQRLNDLVVQIDSGRVSGWERISRDGRVYQAWTGIPYAEPPIGKLRLKAPRPARKWDGVLDATGDLTPCLQPAGYTPMNSSEDCLYLNIYRPKIQKRNLPVIFFVHGGAFQIGAFGPRESADYLMDEDVVLVGIHYRLGVFGFMSLGDSVMPGNFGLKDQVMALKWVKQNIAAFGGNPSSVTAVGGSAGAGSTHLLLKSPACDDLVHRAVSDSGTINKVWSLRRPGLVQNSTLEAVERIGCLKPTSQKMLECLQGLDASQVLSSAPSTNDVTMLNFVPVTEPADAEDPIATFDLSIRSTSKPWITSICTGEWILFKSVVTRKLVKDVRSYLQNHFSRPLYGMNQTQVDEVVKILEKHYFSSATSTTDQIEEAAKMHADIYFNYPAFINMKIHQGLKWIYRFEYDGEISRISNARANVTENVAAHASPGVFYLNTRSSVPGLSTKETPEDYEMSKRLTKFLVNFANHDNPTPDPSPFNWEQFKSSEVLRVTGNGDYFADNGIIEELSKIEKLWDSILGW